MITRPRTPYVDRKPDAVAGLVNAVDATPITIDGATNATAATAGVRYRGETRPSVLGQSPPRAPA
jgi:NaMN:DMB phosphoribosyltransferase